MRDQFVGDIGDFAKYGLLRAMRSTMPCPPYSTARGGRCSRGSPHRTSRSPESPL